MRFIPAADACRRLPLRAVRLAATALVAFAITSCAHGEPAAPTTGILEISIGGLPSGATGNVTLTSQSGQVTYLTSAEQVSRLDPGTYTLVIEPVLVGNARYAADPATQTITITPSRTPIALAIGYRLVSGALRVEVSGVPAGSSGSVAVTGPGGFSRTISTTETMAAVEPGTYTVTTAPLKTAAGHVYAAPKASQQVVVSVGLEPTVAAAAYALASGSIALSIGGLPQGALASVRIAGQQGEPRIVASSETVTGLAPGQYTITPQTVTVAGFAYSGGQPTNVIVEASLAPVTHDVTYALTSGALTVNVAGAPTGAGAPVTITGPAGFQRTIGATTTFSGIGAGDYTIAAANVTANGHVYAPAAASQTVSVPASLTPATANVQYALSTGSLALLVTGLPSGAAASIQVTGPGGFSRQLTATTTITGLVPGAYTVAASPVTRNGIVYGATPASQSIQVSASLVAAGGLVTYAVSGGTSSLEVEITGLPQGVAAPVRVTGPSGFDRSVSGSQTLTGLAPGTYTVYASNLAHADKMYVPAQGQQTVVLAADASKTATVVYNLAGGGPTTGNLEIQILGLPNGGTAPVRLTGPSAYDQSWTTATRTVTGLAPGTYTVAAQNATVGGDQFAPAPASQTIVVAVGTTVTATIEFENITNPPVEGMDLTVDGLYLVQSVQSYARGVPLVAGRAATLRVFGRANESNAARPKIRVRLYSGAAIVATYSTSAVATSVPTTVSEGLLASSWNFAIPAEHVAPGLKVLADIDPDGEVAEGSETNNAFPRTGEPLAIDVRSLPTFELTYVPVVHALSGRTGGVTEANKAQYFSMARKVWPIGAASVQVRAPYTTNVPEFLASDANNAWGMLLDEIRALQIAEGSGRYYYGVMSVNYNSGIAGLAYLNSRAGIGWDYLPSASEVFAHELGHNFGRFHAPCGGPAGPDPFYPYPSASVGQYGMDPDDGFVWTPASPDLMSYCDDPWISDYTFKAALAYREANGRRLGPTAAAARATPRPALLVWGRERHGRLTLEPTFTLVTRPVLPSGSGAYRVEAVGGDGRTLFSHRFTPDDVPDLTGDARHFAFAIPLDGFDESQIASIRVVGPGRQASLGAPRVPTDLGRADVAAEGTGGEVRVTWSDPAVRMALVRDRRTGQVLSFARGGSASVRTRSADMEVVVSDGVRSRSLDVPVRTRTRR